MIFQFLGTSAGEQYPGLWCQCENCTKARKLGGKNIRKNSAAYIYPDCLIDFPPEIFSQAERFGIDLVDLKYLFITHSHEDHFDTFPFIWRYQNKDIISNKQPMKNIISPRFSKLKTLHLIGNQKVCQMIKEIIINKAKHTYKEHALKVHLVQPYREYRVGDIKFIPLLANHNKKKGLNYIIFREGKTILYALDTGWFLPETYEVIKKYTYDLVVIEGTFGYGAETEEHFNFKKLERAYKLFRKDNLLKEKGCFCTSHISPHFSPIHNELAPRLKKKGITLAYDGLKINV